MIEPPINQVVIGGHGTIGFRAVRLLAHGDACEPLHGIRFSVSVILSGDLGATGRLIDFRSVTAALTTFCSGVEGRTLVPLRNQALKAWPEGDVWHVEHRSRRWTLPACDVLALDVVNPTNEVLAKRCLEALRDALRDDPEAGLLRRVEVAVGDAEGSAHYGETWAQG